MKTIVKKFGGAKVSEDKKQQEEKQEEKPQKEASSENKKPIREFNDWDGRVKSPASK
jgi:hypothetical protein